MSIGFESDEVRLRKLRERLEQMSDTQLIEFGKAARRLSRGRVSGAANAIDQLEETRAGNKGLPLVVSVSLGGKPTSQLVQVWATN